jgi:hypothetical protein
MRILYMPGPQAELNAQVQLRTEPSAHMSNDCYVGLSPLAIQTRTFGTLKQAQLSATSPHLQSAHTASASCVRV